MVLKHKLLLNQVIHIKRQEKRRDFFSNVGHLKEVVECLHLVYVHVK